MPRPRSEQLRWPREDGPARLSAQCNERQHCSSFVPARPAQNVLVVGAERPDEFADAMRLFCQGHCVMVINPRETSSAAAFRRQGGTFVRARIEQLPPECCQFDVICENYPYPSGQYYVPPDPFALAW